MCYCGTAQAFEQCCAPIINGEKKADNAEQLMRSRYSAYCVNNSEYIHNTYALTKHAENSVREIKLFAELADFIKLTVNSFNEQGNSAQVHFKAEYICDGYYCQLEEVSNFVIEEDQWRYLDGTLTPHNETKLGRNDTCPCDSGKKFKKCHGS